MSQKRKTTIPRNYSCRNDEMRPLALIYIDRFKIASELQAFTAKDPDVNAAWLVLFTESAEKVNKIVPSKSITKSNSDVTKGITVLSKNVVSYGKELTYWLNKLFIGQSGFIDSFPIIAANDEMRRGNTEGMLDHVATIIQLIEKPETLAALSASAWPPTNLTNYKALGSEVEALNTQQENAKNLIPENTDNATTVRNECYSYIQTILALNDLVYKESNPEKYRTYQLATVLRKIRPAVAPKAKAAKAKEPRTL